MTDYSEITKFLDYLVMERNASPETINAYKKDLYIFIGWLNSLETNGTRYLINSIDVDKIILSV